MPHRRHHNNMGLRQIRQGATRRQVVAMAKRILEHQRQPVLSAISDYQPSAAITPRRCWEPWSHDSSCRCAVKATGYE
jgi:hypothetical protein